MRCHPTDNGTITFTPTIEETEALAALSNDPHPDLAKAVALTQLVNDGTITHNHAAAAWRRRNSAIRGDYAAVIARLASVDPDNLIRVAKSPHTPEDVLTDLAENGPAEAARAVAKNPHTPELLLRRLANDPALPDGDHITKGRTVSAALANPSCPTDVHNRHAMGTAPLTSVRHVLFDTIGERITDPAAFESLRNRSHEHSTVWHLALRNPHCPRAILEHELENRSNPYITVQVYANPTWSSEVLRDCLLGHDPYGAQGAAENPSADPSDLLDAVVLWAARGDQSVLFSIARNPRATPAVLAAMLTKTASQLNLSEGVLWHSVLAHPNANKTVADAATAVCPDWRTTIAGLTQTARKRLTRPG